MRAAVRFRAVIKGPTFKLSAFTNDPAGGNPAAVVPLDRWIEDDEMQAIAAAFNLSETAFFCPVGDSEWHIRWFTPAAEVPLCGHATLASAKVIADRLGHTHWPITLYSASGPLRVDRDGDAIILDFPADPPTQRFLPKGMEIALGVSVSDYFSGRDIHLARVADCDAVKCLTPDFAALRQLVDYALIVTAEGDDCDFVSRFFAPNLGIDEDPVTGAAHCVLTPYWAQVTGKSEFVARQLSRRGGLLQCALESERVKLRGEAVFLPEDFRLD